MAEPGTRDVEYADAGFAASPPNGSAPQAEMDRGWRPWKVVIGSYCLSVAVYGLLSTIGLFQTYWKEDMLKQYTDSEISWIISMFGFLDCLIAAPAGVVFDRYGSRWVLAVNSVVYLASFVGLAFSSTYSELMGCMVMAGVSSGTWLKRSKHESIIHWFKEKAGLATGCVTVSAALGGIFFSVVLQALFDRLPWRDAALILTLILAVFVTLGNVLVETNLPPRHATQGEERAAGDVEISRKACGTWQSILEMVKTPKFWLVTYAIFGEGRWMDGWVTDSDILCVKAYELVLFVQWGSIPSYAVETNFGENQFYLMMSYNIGAFFGRILPPFVSDRLLGPLNTTIAMNVFTLVVVLTIWLPAGATSIGMLYLVVVLMGIGTGSFVPLGVACIGALCKPQDMGKWLGFTYAISGFATLIGNPATGEILAKYGSDGLVSFLAAVLASGLISIGFLRWQCNGRRWLVMGRI
ncbi:major facilitator superfamily domain-containing protein [Cercophora samala]|uniref:Major facilitator superfamily domain-containing protein n=1 Tax=Cercophora samala TaxID=330535 RepID=A0AA39ZLG4_9PEZI|nr:major facilitator superfamily domain-containing protein [Cercophora samala]